MTGKTRYESSLLNPGQQRYEKHDKKQGAIANPPQNRASRDKGEEGFGRSPVMRGFTYRLRRRV
eukprot:756378-Hanusia_phi.AAC.1